LRHLCLCFFIALLVALRDSGQTIRAGVIERFRTEFNIKSFERLGENSIARNIRTFKGIWLFQLLFSQGDCLSLPQKT
jgi:hypothetical protein